MALPPGPWPTAWSGGDAAGHGRLELATALSPAWQSALELLQADPWQLMELVEDLRQHNRLGEAWLVGLEALRRYPEAVPLLREQARVVQACGDIVTARELLERCLVLAPDAVATRLDMVRLLLELGEPQEAARQLDQVPSQGLSRLEQGHTASLRLLLELSVGNDLRTHPGLRAFLAASATDPQSFRQALGLLRARGQHAWALEWLDQAPAALEPWRWDLERVQSLCDLGRRAEALARIAQLAPGLADDPEPLQALAAASHALGDLDLEGALLERVMSIHPDQARTWYHLARWRRDRLDHDGCAEALERTLTLDPFYLQAHADLGIQRLQQGDPAGARECFARALALRPPSPAGFTLQGVIAFLLGDVEGAEAAARQAIAMAPRHVAAHLNLAVVLLLQGRYDEGWSEYEWRLQHAGAALHRPDRLPLWDGETPIQELVVVAEQGIGDLVQFLRYGSVLAWAVPAVTLVVPGHLQALVQQVGLFQRVVCFDDDLASTPGAAWIPLLSLPRLLRLTPDHVLWDGPYLPAPPERVALWRERFEADPGPGLVVGLNWQGQSTTEQATLAGRSFPLEVLAPLAALPALRFVSLQKGIGSEQLDGCAFRDRFVACQPAISEAWDFLDTMAILECCDLVITSDTCVAHLAGALGKPTWLLLQHVPDWRWGLEGHTTHWYASLRLFRQRRHGDWDGVVLEVREALVELLAARSPGQNAA